MPVINNPEKSDELKEKIKVIDNEVELLFVRVAELGEAGKIEESESLNTEIEKLIKKKEPAPKYTFPKNDANSRMQAAQSLYENEYFGAAARIFEEAVAIFTEQYGPEHEYTQSAMQNMLIATNNEIIQLWREVVDESVEKYHQEQASSKKNDSIVDDDTW